MFYKVLFLLTLFNLFKSCKSFVKENVIFDGGEMAGHLSEFCVNRISFQT